MYAKYFFNLSIGFENQNDKNLTLLERINIEKNIFHWLPYKRIYYHKYRDGTIQEQQCPERNPAINEFPPGIWTRKYFINNFNCFKNIPIFKRRR